MRRQEGADTALAQWGEHALDSPAVVAAATAALRAVALGVVVSDPQLPDNPLVLVNPAFERLTGYSATESLGRNCRFLQGPGTDPDAVAELRAAQREQRSTSVVLLNVRKDGSSFWNEVTIAPVEGPDGEARYFLGLQHDVTSRVEAERGRDRAAAEAAAASSRLEAVLAQLPSGVAIAEVPSGRLVRVNRRFEEIWRRAWTPSQSVEEYDAYEGFHPDGRLLAAEDWPLARTVQTGEVVTDQEVLIRRGDGSLGTILVSSAPVVEAGRVVAAVVVFSDVTERRAAEALLTRANERTVELARTLQRSLLPPALPVVPELELAAVYAPAGEGLEVGGDFYDVFRHGRDHWVVLLGDVMGKGAAAAAVAALARSSVRTAAVRSRRPSSILGQLNQVLAGAPGEVPDRPFCTAVCARVRPEPGRARVKLALGGHPPPAVLRADGSVQRVGVVGSLLGVVDDPRLRDVEVTLGPGDSLLLFTDGLTDTRVPGHPELADDEVASLLAAHAGRAAATVATGVEDDVLALAGGRLRDDLAIVVLRVPPAQGA